MDRTIVLGDLMNLVVFTLTAVSLFSYIFHHYVNLGTWRRPRQLQSGGCKLSQPDRLCGEFPYINFEAVQSYEQIAMAVKKGAINFYFTKHYRTIQPLNTN